MARKLDEILKELTVDQAKAAELIYENDLLSKGKRRSYVEIAKEIGVSDRTLRKWRQLPAMLEYKTAVTDTYLADNRTRVMQALINECEAGNASMMKLYMQTMGMLVDKAEVEIKAPNADPDAVAARLANIKNRY
ncbi:phBC6A51 family helix-turn-helix protein [Lysinibacillus sphaericus]|uniref:Phage protein n=1 Tax=Lysinibacillus sphaericus OT4b.31 TaxID=1285586 RepID=R7ZJ34_LYSSH|nr:phBC6A51 family helix-turn-helix protein [Lysinibacillus sphaericus]EON74132.1 Phage protein [Lysinibacillus sphaericus OT4b.31]